MKKSLVFLLALVMVFAFATSAFAVEYSDIGDQSQLVQDAIYKLSALGIVQGYEDGTWQPDANITRAEFAQIACLAGGYGDSYASLTNTASPFSDVKVGVWYTGWINLAYSAGYIQGDGNGLFRPNDNITENEVITVLVRLLNYNDNLTGTWPVNYVRQAGVLGLLDDVSLTGSAAAKRSLVAVLTSEVLDEDMVVWSKDTESFKPDENKSTLLAESFSGTTADAYVAQAAEGEDTVTAGWQYSNFDNDTMEVVFEKKTTQDGDKKDVAINKDALSGTMKVTSDFQVSGGLDIYDLAGHYGSAIYTVKSDKKSLAYLDVKSSTIAAEELESSNGRVKVDGKTYSFAADSEYYYADTEGLIADLKAGTDPEDSHFIVYLNEDGEVYDILENANWAVSGGVVDTVNTSTGRVSYDSTFVANEGGRTQTNFKDENVIVFKNGEVTKGLDALKSGDVVTVTHIDNEVDYAVVVLDEQAAGKFSKATTDEFTIGGKAYSVSDNAIYQVNDDDFEAAIDDGAVAENLRDQFGQDATFYIGRTGELVVLKIGDAAAGNTVYGVLLDYSTDDSNMGGDEGTVTSIKVFNQEGKTVTYDVVDDAYVSTDNYTDEEDYEVINNYVGFDSDYAQLLKFKVNSNGAISKALDPELDTLATAEGTWDVEKDYKTMNDEEISDSVIAFNVETKDGDGKYVKSVSLLTKDDLLKGDVSYGAGSNYIISSSKISVAMIVDFGRSNSGTYGIVSDYGFADSDFDDALLLANGDKYDLNGQGGFDTDDLIGFSVKGDKIDSVDLLVDSDADTDADTDAILVGTFDFGSTQVKADAITSSRVKVNGTSYKFTSDTSIYDYSDPDSPVELTSSDISGLDKNSYTFAGILKEDPGSDNELDLLVVLSYEGE